LKPKHPYIVCTCFWAIFILFFSFVNDTFPKLNFVKLALGFPFTRPAICNFIPLIKVDLSLTIVLKAVLIKYKKAACLLFLKGLKIVPNIVRIAHMFILF